MGLTHFVVHYCDGKTEVRQAKPGEYEELKPGEIINLDFATKNILFSKKDAWERFFDNFFNTYNWKTRLYLALGKFRCDEETKINWVFRQRFVVIKIERRKTIEVEVVEITEPQDRGSNAKLFDMYALISPGSIMPINLRYDIYETVMAKVHTK